MKAAAAASRDGAARVSIMNLRTAAVPGFSNGYTSRRSFPDGLYALSLLTASDVCDAVGVLMAAVGTDSLVIANLKTRALVQAQLESTYSLAFMLNKEKFSDADLIALDAAVLSVKAGVASLFAEFSASDLNFIKFHLPDHLTALIRNLGAARYWNTGQLERSQSTMVNRHFQRTSGRARVSGQIFARQSRVVFCNHQLPLLLHQTVPPAPATIPEEEDFMLLRGKMSPLSSPECDVSDDQLDAVAAAWPPFAATQLGDAYDADIHGWDPAYAVQYRRLRWRRRDIVDSSVHGHRTSVVSVLILDQSTGVRTVFNLGIAATAFIALPEFFFAYTDPLFLGSLPAADDGAGEPALTDDSDAAGGEGDFGDPEDDEDDRRATSISRLDPRAMVMAFTWLKPTAAGSPLATASAPFQHHCAREPWDTGSGRNVGLQLEPVSVVFSKHRFFPFFRAPAHATVATATRTPDQATCSSSDLVSTLLW